MSEHSWVLKGVDPESRQKAAAEAERRGVSLADYLTDVVLQNALLEQMLTPPQDIDAAPQEPSATTAPADNFAMRHRLEALERRLGLSVGGLDNAVHSLDSAVFGLAARVDEAEVLAADTADALHSTLADVGNNFASLRKRLADTEDQTGALSEAQEILRAEFAERTAVLGDRIDSVDDAVRAANTTAAQLAVAHEALKYAVADDFSAFAQESTARLSAGLDEVRIAADTAAEQADAAVAHLIVELRNMREALEQRVAEDAAETRERVHAAFTEAAERLHALSSRVNETERLSLRSAEQLRAQIADVEDGAQTALEETAESLRQAGAALAAELARATRDHQTALDSVHADLSNEVADLRERQAGGLARLKQVDAQATATAADLATLRSLVDQSLAVTAQDTRDAVAILASRLAHVEADAAENQQAAQAETHRVEACTLAALEKLAQDRVSGDAALERRLDQQALATDAQIEQIRQRLDRQAETQDAFQSGALARLKLLDTAVEGAGDITARLDELDLAERAIDRGFDERLLRLEAHAENTGTETALAAMRGQLGALAAQLDASGQDQTVAQEIEDLRARVAAFGSQASDASERVQSVTRMLGRLTAQHADVVTQSEERLRKLELALADVRLDKYAAPPESLNEVEQRVAALEARQAETFDVLRADITHFIEDNTRRLEALEHGIDMAPSHDVAAEFQALRRRMEERILGVEQRSVRALEQVADTMAMLEQRFNGEDTVAATRSA